MAARLPPILSTLALCALLGTASAAQASEWPGTAFPHQQAMGTAAEKPTAGDLTAADLAKDCFALEGEFAGLEQQAAKHYRGGSTETYAGASFWVNSTSLAYAAILLPLAQDLYAEHRIEPLKARIEVLRQHKARKRCFEF